MRTRRGNCSAFSFKCMKISARSVCMRGGGQELKLKKKCAEVDGDSGERTSSNRRLRSTAEIMDCASGPSLCFRKLSGALI